MLTRVATKGGGRRALTATKNHPNSRNYLILQALGIQFLFILDVLGIFWAVFTVSGEFLEPVANFWEFLVEVFPIFSRFGSLFLVPSRLEPQARLSITWWSAYWATTHPTAAAEYSGSTLDR